MRLFSPSIEMFQGIWEDIDEFTEKIIRKRGRKALGAKKKRWKTKEIYKSLMEIPPGAQKQVRFSVFEKTFGEEGLSELPLKLRVKRLRSVLRRAMKYGIIERFSTFQISGGDYMIVVKRSEIPKEELESILGLAILEEEEEGLESLEE